MSVINPITKAPTCNGRGFFVMSLDFPQLLQQLVTLAFVANETAGQERIDRALP